MKINLLASGAATIATMIAGPASALVYTITYEGFTSGDIWAPGGQHNVADEHFTATFWVNTATPDSLVEGDASYPTYRFQTIYGHGAASPVTGQFTVDGISVAAAGEPLFGSAFEEEGIGDPESQNPRSEIGHIASFENVETYTDPLGVIYTITTRTNMQMYLYSYYNDFGLDYNVNTAPPSRLRADDDEDKSAVDMYRTIYNPATGTTTTISEYRNIYVRSYTVSTGIIPEPSSWGFMIVGLGIAGSLLRGQNYRRFVEPRKLAPPF